jgi:3-hydroxyisobutyrate dehydrogenase
MKAGFVGLGAMGWHMAGHLAAKELLGGVWNRTRPTAERFAREHRTVAVATPAELWKTCDVVVLCVSADAQVLDMVDRLGVPEARGKLVIDASTVARETAIEAAKELAHAGARFVDAPVTGGTEGAKKATLTFMVGGAEVDVAHATPLLRAMGARVVHMGHVGAGQATKAVNQVVCAGIAQAVTEGVAFAEALKLPLDKVLEVVGSGAAGSWFMTNRGKNFIADEYPLGFKLSLHLKDLYICREMAHALGGKLPVTEATIPPYEELKRQGHGDEDISTLYRLNRHLFPGTGAG